MDTYTMNKIKGLLRVLSGKAVLCAVLTLLFAAASAPLFAQSAEVRYAGVFYKDAPSTEKEMYCDYTIVPPDSASSSEETNEKFLKRIKLGGGPVFIDGKLRVKLKSIYSPIGGTLEKYQPERQKKKEYRIGNIYYLYEETGKPLIPYDVYEFEVVGFDDSFYGFSIGTLSTSDENKSFVFKPAPGSNSTPTTDPWASSALLEYDQPYPSATPEDNKYPNHCLALCMNVRCTNKPMSMSTYSIAFPLQQLKFDVVKYYNGKNIEDAEGTPSIRTINLYPDTESTSAKCGSYRCPGGPNEGYTCTSPEYELVNGTCYKFGDPTVGVDSSNCTIGKDDLNCPNKNCKYVIFNNDGARSNVDIPFCAAWDGSYEIAGEFGKSNGDFGFRATVATDVPGDNIITDKITFNSTIAYPGMNQIPIQVDVTNVHAVRSTPTVVGNITAVAAQPYTFAYRLS